MTEAKGKDAVAVQGDLALEEVVLEKHFQIKTEAFVAGVKVKVLEEDLAVETDFKKETAEIIETAEAGTGTEILEEEILSEQTGKEEDIDSATLKVLGLY